MRKGGVGVQIHTLLHIGRGVTALVGGGGKTTLMLTLARELSKKGSVIVTTSTKIRPPEGIEILLDPDEEKVREMLAQKRVLCVAAEGAEGKLCAPKLGFEALERLADYVLVEADGAKMLPLKAHAPYEPVIPENAQRSVMVVGADGFGKRIADVCHRPERYASLAGVSVESVVTPETEAAVLKKEGGFDRVYINKLEREKAFEAANRLASLLDCPVIAGSLHMGVYLCLR